jgi:RHS repeat-associated protein
MFISSGGRSMCRFKTFQTTTVFAFCLLSLASFGQGGVDLSTFSTVESHGDDAINLQNLTIYVNMGIRNKQGAIPFSYSLVASSLCTGYTAHPPTGRVACGISTVFPTPLYPNSPVSNLPQAEVSGFLAIYDVGHNVECPNGNGSTLLMTNYAVVGAGGVPHALPAADEVDSQGCYSSGFTDVALDGSGLGVSVTSATRTTPTLFAKNGTYISQSQLSQSDIDANGNAITESWTASSCCTFTDSLGTTFLTTQNGNYTWTDLDGNNQTITAVYTPATIETAFGCPNITDADGSGTLFTQLNYPDLSSIKLSYEETPGGGGYTGRIASVTLRTGGTINYQYSGGNNGINCKYWVPPTLSRITQDGTTTYTWASLLINNTYYGNTTTVIDPGANKTIYTFMWPYGVNGTSVLTQVQTFQNVGTVASPSYALLATDVMCYNGNSSSCASTPVTYPILEKDVYHTINGMSTSSRSQTTYDKYGNITGIAKYDFGATAFTYQTSTQYGSWNGSTCVPIGSYVYDRACDVKTTDGATPPNTLAETRNTYDAHGNLVTKSVWTGTTWLTSSYTYNGNGTVKTFTDINQTGATQWSYSYAPTGSGGCNGLLLTQSQLTIATGDTLTTNQTWNCNGGVLVTSSDANMKSTIYGYANSSGTPDPFWRVSSVTDPTEYTTYTNYTPTSVNSHSSFNSSVEDVTTFKDGLGRPILTQKQQGPASSNYDSVSTSYIWNGPTFRTGKSTPCIQTHDVGCSSNFTNSTVDPLQRPLSTQDPLGGIKTETYSQNDALLTLGPAPAGENTKRTQSEYDGLGRVKSVCQILTTGGSSCGQNTAASGYLTSYSYGTFAGGTSKTITRGSQTRTYVYDALGRLVSETHPETGTTKYTYDSVTSGNCSVNSPGDLVLETDNAGNGTCYKRDALNRVTSISQSNSNSLNAAATPDRCFVFDSATVNGIVMGITATRLAEQYTVAQGAGCAATKITDEGFTYDADGRITDVYEDTPNSGGYYHSSAAYWPNGAMESLSGIPGYPALNYGLDGEGRLGSAQLGTFDIVCDTTCSAASTKYNAASQATVVNIGGTGNAGSGDNDTYTYDATGRMASYAFTVGSTPTTMTGTLLWNQDATLRQLIISDGFNAGGTQTCNYGTSTVMGYDDLGRLLNVNCGSIWQQTFSYDEYDNITKSGSSSWACSACYNTNTNQYNSILSGQISYDTNGNLLNDTFQQYNWDAYGHPVAIAPATGSGTCGSSGITCVTYDASGRAVEEQIGTKVTQILYSPVGKTAIMSGQTTDSGYLPLPGGATLYINGSIGNRFLWHKDWLGTVRLSTSVPGRSLKYDRAFAPYGEMYDNFGSSTTELDFTGDTQDIVSGTFDTPNRELNPTQGRWISTDPGRSGWNLYAYSTDPNTGTDPTGLWVDQNQDDPSFPDLGWNFTSWRWGGRAINNAGTLDTAAWSNVEFYITYTVVTVKNTSAASDKSKGSGDPQEGQTAGQQARSDPSVTIVIVHGFYFVATFADHAGLILTSDNDQIIYDPGGSYQQDKLPKSGTGGVMSAKDDGANSSDYVNYETVNEKYVTTYKIEISSADAAKISDRLVNGNNPDNTPFKCATDVSSVLHGIGPFKNLPIEKTPGGLETDVSRMSVVEKAWFRGTKF